MDIRKLQRTIVDALEAVKAQDIAVFNTEGLTSLFDRVIVASGTSNRQTRALASSVRDSVKAAGFDVRNPEGEETGEWVLVDCGAAVVHIMQPAIRAYYKLEELWGAKPVRVKLGGTAPRTTAPAATGGPADATVAPPVRRATTRKAATARAQPDQAAPTASPTGKRTRRASSAADGATAAATKPATPRKPAAAQTAAKPAAAKKAAVKTSAARSGATKRSAARKTAV